MRDISVIIPSYNSAATIGRTVESVLRCRGGLLKELIVVDSSDDGKTVQLLKNTAGVRLIRLEKKTIPAAGRNIGAAEASGETLAFIDSDAFAAEDWLEKIAEARDSGSDVGGGSVLLPDFQRNNRLALAQFFLQFNEFMDCGAVREKKFIPSVNLFCEKNLFKRIGGYPDIRASEDVLFGLAAARYSKVMFHPEMKVSHIFREDRQAYLSNQVMLGKYILIYRRETYGGFLYKGVAAALLLPLIVLVKFAGITKRVLSGKPGYFFAYISALPLLWLGLYYWAKGYYQGCVEKKNA